MQLYILGNTFLFSIRIANSETLRLSCRFKC